MSKTSGADFAKKVRAASTKQNCFRMLHIIAMVAAVTGFVAIGYSVLAIEVLPTMYSVLAIGIALAIGVLLAIFNIRASGEKLVRSMVLYVFTGLWLAISVVGLVFARSTADFISSLSVSSKEYQEYSVVALESHADGIMSVEGEVLGLLDGDMNRQKVKDAIGAEVSVKYDDYSELVDASMAISEGSLDALIVPSAYMELIRENRRAFYDEVKVIFTFRIESEDAGTINIDVDKPFVVYVSGIDTHGGIEVVSRSDVNMLMVFNPNEHKILLVNTPRDYYVQLHGTSGTKDKLTHAGIYGIDMSEATLEDLYGVEIGYHVKVNFDSLIKLIDVIGDIDVYSDYDFKSEGGFSFHRGMNRLGSEQALAFARERHAFADGDKQRGKNQQRVMEGIFNKLHSPVMVARYQSILSALGGSFQTNASKDDINMIVKQQIGSMGQWKMESMSVTGTGASLPTYSMGSQLLYVMIPDEGSVKSAENKIRQYLSE